MLLTNLLSEFQSHIGAIRIIAPFGVNSIKRNFNPTLVQLEFFDKQGKFLGLEKFQSHIGAIRINCSLLKCSNFEKFQSHIGAIRIGIKNALFGTLQYFNPTLVQLELSIF